MTAVIHRRYEDMICDNIGIKDGHLLFAGQDTTELAAKYGTPLYLLDEDRIRANIRAYKAVMERVFPQGSLPIYASKANSFKQIYRICAQEGIGVDVVSGGEIYTAVQAGFDMSRAYFQGNNKTDAEIALALDSGVGYFVVDCMEELEMLETMAAQRGIVQKILLRVTPGIDPHTYEQVATGKVDSKFGSPIETGSAEHIVKRAIECSHINLRGIHCHVGSMVFGEDVYEQAAVVMLEFMAHVKQKLGYELEVLDLGGGYGVAYADGDGHIDITSKTESVAKAIMDSCERLGLAYPQIILEPGRSIVADAGMTLYTAGAMKVIDGYKSYISVDGGMTDNPRYALYGSKYTVYDASRMDEQADTLFDVVGKCCESGDIIQPRVMLPAAVRRGDIIAVCTTGAYNYSMASNYNRIARPAMVMLSGGESYVVVKRESMEDIVRNDV